MKILVASCVALMAFTASVSASLINFDVNQAIPDNDPSGLLSSVNVTGSGVHNIQNLAVWLQVDGSTGYDGDLYVTLSHGTGYSVLLNRIGRTSGNDYGSIDPGLSSTFVLFDLALSGDIHGYSDIGAPITGAWAPDGRTSDPSMVLDSDARTALLSSFNGLGADGTWNLFAADLSPAGESRLISWGLDFGQSTIGEPVPEASTWIAGGVLLLPIVASLIRRYLREQKFSGNPTGKS